jgi:predicted dehydrogenase
MILPAKRLALGVIGCGWVTQNWHLPALAALAEVEIVAVADCDEVQADRTADRFGIPHRYRTAHALLAHRQLHAVAVCVPPQYHVEIGLAALDAGKHLFIEKPLALNLGDCDSLVDRAKQASATVMVGFNLRWHRLVRQARVALQSGALGRLSMIRSIFTNGVYQNGRIPEWRRQRVLGGGVLLDMAIHHIDLWRFLLDSEVEEIFVASRSSRWDDETATVTGRMANGILISAVFSAETTESHEMEFYGQSGRLCLSCYRFDGLEWHPRSHASGGMGVRVTRLASKLRTMPHAWAALRHGGDMLGSYRAQWRHFIESIQRREPAGCTLEDGRRAVQIALAAIESSSCGRPITLN